MNDESRPCPKCKSPYGYFDRNMWICPECFYEWKIENNESKLENENAHDFLDSNGTPLKNGDAVTTIKDLKVGNGTLKSGTKVKNIKLLEEPVNGHDISCKVAEHGNIYLKCSVVKKKS